MLGLIKGLDYGSGRKPREGFSTSDYSGLPIYDYMIKDYKVLGVKEGEYDIIYCRNVLHHIPEVDLVKVVDEFRRILKLGGKLIISEPKEAYFTENKILDIIWYRFLYYDREVHIPIEYVDYRKYLTGFIEVSSKEILNNEEKVFILK